MVAVEFCDPESGAPSAEIAKAVQQRALERGLILLTCGAHGNVVRFLHPLTIPMPQFEAALKTVREVVSEVVPVVALVV
jgi:4-aminobutyrate aminotransferase